MSVTDTLPPGTWTIAPGAGVTCPTPTATGSITCTLTAPLAKDASVTIKVSRTVTTADCGPLNNSATVSATNEDASKLGNNSANASITVVCSTLILTKTPDNGIVYPGGTATFTIRVTNTGTNDAVNVQVTDTLPAGTWTVTTADGTCNSPATTNFTCQLGTIPGGEWEEITVSRPVTGADCGPLNNTATATASNVANSSTDTGLITVECAEVGIVKTATDASIPAGDTAQYQIVVTNYGPNAAQGLHISDDLPAGVWTISTTNEGLTCPASASVSFTCTYSSPLPVNGTLTVTVSRATTTADCGPLLNEATVAITNEQTTGQLHSNTDDATITVECTDIGVVKTPDGATIDAGTVPAVFTITVTNNGAFTANDVVVNDFSLPTGTWTFTVPAGAVCVPPTVGNTNSGTASGSLVCTFDEIPAGQSVVITLSRATTATDCGQLVNDVRVSSSNEPPRSNLNNEDRGTINVNCADVSVEKVPTGGNSTISAGDPIGFTITVRNTGDGVATDVTLTDTLPAGIDWTINPAVTGCAIDKTTPGVQVLECDLGDLASDATITINVVGATDPEDCGTITNTVTIDGTNLPAAPREGDDPYEASATVTVNCPDLDIIKTAEATTVSAGDPITFTITVTNSGLGIARNVNLTDTLPAGIDWTINPAVTGCAIDKTTTPGVQVLECDFGDLAYTNQRVVTVTGATSSAVCGLVPNTATVSADNFLTAGQTPVNFVSDDATVTVNCPDIVVEKTAEVEQLYPGDTATFVITVTNAGPGNAKGVTINDITLPAGIWTVTPDAGITCDFEGGTASAPFTCTVTGDMAPDASLSIEISRTVTTDDCAGLTNEVTVTATNEDPALTSESANGNNADDATITVLCTELEIEKVAGPSPINAGDEISFTITVTNTGDTCQRRGDHRRAAGRHCAGPRTATPATSWPAR